MEVKQAPYGDIALENRVGNALPPERLAQIRGILRHFNWTTERPHVVLQLAEIEVYGDVDGAAQVGSFYDYRHQGWVVAKVVPV